MVILFAGEYTGVSAKEQLKGDPVGERGRAVRRPERAVAMPSAQRWHRRRHGVRI